MDIRFNGTWSSFDHRWFARLFCMFQVRSVSIVEHRDSLDVFKYSKWNLWSFYFFHIIQSSTMNMKIFEWAPRLRIYIIDFFSSHKMKKYFFFAWDSRCCLDISDFCCVCLFLLFVLHARSCRSIREWVNCRPTNRENCPCSLQINQFVKWSLNSNGRRVRKRFSESERRVEKMENYKLSHDLSIPDLRLKYIFVSL